MHKIIFDLGAYNAKIKKEYIVSSNNKKKAVFIDIETFEKLEELLENYGLGKYM